jgi:hypothetical protein
MIAESDVDRRARECVAACEGLTPEQVAAIPRLVAWFTDPGKLADAAWRDEWIFLEKLFLREEG